jgi:hypothetical protein
MKIQGKELFERRKHSIGDDEEGNSERSQRCHSQDLNARDEMPIDESDSYNLHNPSERLARPNDLNSNFTMELDTDRKLTDRTSEARTKSAIKQDSTLRTEGYSRSNLNRPKKELSARPGDLQIQSDITNRIAERPRVSVNVQGCLEKAKFRGNKRSQTIIWELTSERAKSTKIQEKAKFRGNSELAE